MNRRTIVRVFAVELALAALAFATPAAAQQRDSTHADVQSMNDKNGPPKDFFQNMMGDMTQSMTNMAEAMVGAQLKVLSKPETAEQLATFTHNYYEALVKKGFTKSEALQIVTSVQGLPIASGK